MRASLKAGVTVASVPQLVPTPRSLAAEMAALANIDEGDSVLEPSAGTGALVRAVRERQPAADVFAVEIDHRLCEALSPLFAVSAGDNAARTTRHLLQGDFLEVMPDQLGAFDVVLMNPPFANAAPAKLLLARAATRHVPRRRRPRRAADDREGPPMSETRKTPRLKIGDRLISHHGENDHGDDGPRHTGRDATGIVEHIETVRDGVQYWTHFAPSGVLVILDDADFAKPGAYTLKPQPKE